MDIGTGIAIAGVWVGWGLYAGGDASSSVGVRRYGHIAQALTLAFFIADAAWELLR